MKNTWCILSILLMFMVGCNKPRTHYYDFVVVNKTGYKITVRSTKAFQNDEQARDILPGESSVLYSEKTSTNQKKVYDLYTDSINYFNYIRIRDAVTGKPTRYNMKARLEWNFKITSDDQAVYTLETDSLDF